MNYLGKEDILFINKKTIERHGGKFVPPDNMLNEEPLNYLVEAVRSKIFGEEIYPKISQKAGLYMFNIISNHIFQDGNKRTGLGAALLFLKLNGFQLSSHLTSLDKNGDSDKPESSVNEMLIDFTLATASGNVSLDQCQNWMELNIEKIQS